MIRFYSSTWRRSSMRRSTTGESITTSTNVASFTSFKETSVSKLRLKRRFSSTWSTKIRWCLSSKIPWRTTWELRKSCLEPKYAIAYHTRRTRTASTFTVASSSTNSRQQSTTPISTTLFVLALIQLKVIQLPWMLKVNLTFSWLIISSVWIV